jgi:hypothetical protein
MKSYGASAPDANYLPNVKYMLEIDGIAIMAFEKLTPSDSEWGVIEGRTGIDPLVKIPSSGLKKTQTIEGEKHIRDGGIADIRELLTWHSKGSLDRRSGALVYMDREDVEIIRLNFKNAWISKTSLPDLDGTADSSPMVFKFTIVMPELVPA